MLSKVTSLVHCLSDYFYAISYEWYPCVYFFSRDKDVSNQANDPNSNFSLCTNYHPSERSKLCSVSPKPSLKPKEKGWATSDNRNVLFHQKCLFDAKTSTMSFAKPPSLTKAKTLSIESRDCKNESLCATWPPVGKTGTILGEWNKSVYSSFLLFSIEGASTNFCARKFTFKFFFFFSN